MSGIDIAATAAVVADALRASAAEPPVTAGADLVHFVKYRLDRHAAGRSAVDAAERSEPDAADRLAAEFVEEADRDPAFASALDEHCRATNNATQPEHRLSSTVN